MNNSILIKGPKIYSERGVLNGGLLIEGGVIKKIININEGIPAYCDHVLEFDNTYHLIPGMIDIHMHGLAGHDCMDATFESLDGICRILPQEGTTSFLATTITEDDAKIEAALSNIRDFAGDFYYNGAEILGINLEGPFISAEKSGAHNSAKIKKPSVRLFKKWQDICNHMIKVVTVAPELENSFDLIRYLTTRNVVVSMGHTMAKFDEAIDAINVGCKMATHLFNAMSGLDHRNPGAAAAALLSDKILAEIIVDGIHVHRSMVQFAYHLKGSDRLLLVTDAMRAKCLHDGTYDFGGQTVFVENGRARLQDGTLAGSLLKMKDAFANMHNYCGLYIEDLIKMTSINQAKLLGIYDRKGSIAEGKDGDIVVLDSSFNVVLTVCRGHISYSL